MKIGEYGGRGQHDRRSTTTLQGIKMIDEAGDNVINIDVHGYYSSDWVSQELKDDESIIGVYGRKSMNDRHVFNCLGFVVWNR